MIRAQEGDLAKFENTAPVAVTEPKRLTWTGPPLLTVGRSVFILGAQGVVALILMSQGNHAPWLSAGRWWTVDGTLADIACLALLWKFTRKEGTTLRSLIGKIRWRHGRDLWTGLGFFLLLFPLFVVGGMLSNALVYGSFTLGPHATGSAYHPFPLWGIIYSLLVWWVVWTPTEQMTYQGYALPRLCALTGHNWMAMVIVGFWWTLQHGFLPFVPDWRVTIWRCVMVAPGLIAMMVVYLRTRRLPLMIVAQWPMDIVASTMSTLH